jgi:hypothetical protein
VARISRRRVVRVAMYTPFGEASEGWIDAMRGSMS